MPASLVQLVARFRPDADGVGETALNLANVLRKDFGIRSHFLVYNPPRPEPGLEIPDNFPHTIERISAPGATPLNSALDRLTAAAGSAPVLLLHYVSYGFSRQGTPFWLPSALERFVGRGGRLINLFHELYAPPRFPSRTVVSSWLQRRIFRRVLSAGEFAFTSSADFLEVLERENRAHCPASLIGICSNVGEPKVPVPLNRRKRRLIVFGRFVTRKQLYARYLPELERIARHLEMEEIADVGHVEDPGWLNANVVSRLGPLVRTYGMLAVPAASQILEDSVVGALSYMYSLRGKSSVFAAYQAHATAILLFPDSAKEDRPEPGSWSLTADELLALPAQSLALQDRLQEAATAAHRHYKFHRSARSMAETLLPALEATGSKP